MNQRDVVNCHTNLRGVVAVTVKHIPLTRETYHELLSALDELNESYGKTAESENARRWVHYRWALAQGGVGDLESHWPDLESVPQGNDAFPDLPVTGVPVDVSDESL